MNMHILSDSQHQELAHALAKVQTILESCTSVVLDSKLATPTAKVVAKSQTKTRKSSGKRGVSVLNDAKVMEIKRQLAAGNKSVSKIAKEFGVHITTINCIKWGKTWKHVQLQQEVTA
jgi:transcriptional regulator with PAS, ATPase and Fis domain